MAIKINNTTVIDNNRQLTAIANADATTVDALFSNSNMPGDYIKATYSVTTTGTWAKGGGVSGDYVIAYCINGGGSGAAVRSSNNNIAQGGFAGNCGVFVFDYDALPSTVNCVIGAGGASSVVSTTIAKSGVMGGDTTFNGFGMGGQARWAAFVETYNGADGYIGTATTDYVTDWGGYAASAYGYYADANQLTIHIIGSTNGATGKVAYRELFYGQRTYAVDSERNGNTLPQYPAEVCACGCPAAMNYNNVLRVGYNKSTGGTFAQTGTGGYGVAGTGTVTATAGNNYGAGGGGAVSFSGTVTSGAGYQGLIMIAVVAGTGKPAAQTSIRFPVPHLIATKLGIAS